jgi:hypothetical protein
VIWLYGIEFIVSITQMVWGYPFVCLLGSCMADFGHHPAGTLGNPALLGALLALVLPIILQRVPLGAVGLAALVVTTSSRMAYLGSLVGTALCRPSHPRLIGMAGGAVVGMWIVLSLGGGPHLEDVGSSMIGRVSVWEYTLERIAQRPVFGWGANVMAVPRQEGQWIPARFGAGFYLSEAPRALWEPSLRGYPPNPDIDRPYGEPFYVTYMFGIAGFLGMLWIWGRALLRIPQSPEQRAIRTGLLSYLVVLLLWWSHVGVANVAWMLVGLLAARE